MIAEGQLTKEWVAEYISEHSVLQLPNNKLKEGSIVFQNTLLDVNGVTSGFLFVSPKGKILEHMHISEAETYWDIMGNSIEICNKMASHFLENVSEEKWLIVRFEKRKDV